MREFEDMTGAIVDASLPFHRDLGPGLLKSVFEAGPGASPREAGLSRRAPELRFRPPRLRGSA
jgi:hypothetical protein